MVESSRVLVAGHIETITHNTFSGRCGLDTCTCMPVQVYDQEEHLLYSTTC